MTVLGIETSDDYVGVGLAGDDGVMASAASEPEMRNKNLLHEFMFEFLRETGRNVQEIDGISVSLGPGSFTGLRVGLAAAKGICWSNDIPLAGVPSTTAIIESLEPRRGKYLVLKNARRDEFYFGGFDCDGASFKRSLPDRVGGRNEILELLSGGYRIVGRRAQINDTGFSPADLIEYNPQHIGGVVALLGRRLIASGETINVADSAPEYLRDPGSVITRR